MIALDTNVLARLLLRDDEAQYRRAVQLLGDGREYTAPPTVFLELAWVLISSGFDRTDVAKGLKGLLGLAAFRPSHSTEIAAAIVLYEAGLDFADALHLALCDGSDALVTFDGRFAKRAERLGATPPVQMA
jgi:predicted nucleic acid-binding protein